MHVIIKIISITAIKGLECSVSDASAYFSATDNPLELEDLLKELSWTLRLKLLNEMHITAAPKPETSSIMTEPTPEQKEDISRRDDDVLTRRVGVQSFVMNSDGVKSVNRKSDTLVGPPLQEKISADENSMRLKLFRLMYETVRDSDLKVKRAELIQAHYSNTTSFQIGYLMGDVTDKFTIMTDISTTLDRFYGDWMPIEHINAYEQIANQAIEISHLIDLMRMANKRDNKTSALQK